MLADNLADQVADGTLDHVYPDGTSHFDALRGVVERIDAAASYEFDRDAVAMAAHVSLTKPSSILAALPWVRLPAPMVWIEFAAQDLRSAMADLGSPNLPHGETKIERIGFLLTDEGDHVRWEYVHRHRKEGGSPVIDLAPVMGRFFLAAATERPSLAPVTGTRGASLTQGRLREYLKLLSSDPMEIAAERELNDRHHHELHPEMEAVMRAAEAAMGKARVTETVVDQGREGRRLFSGMIVPALILLNCRNAVATESVPAPDKLNKARAKRGKRPIRDRVVVRMHLNTRQAMKAARHGDGGRAMRASIVAGHFKVRKPGRIFWWSWHSRVGWGTPMKRVSRVGA